MSGCADEGVVLGCADCGCGWLGASVYTERWVVGVLAELD